MSQGITTIVVGQDGALTYPLAGFLEGMEKRPSAVNVASSVGHGTIRRQVMSADFQRRATDAEVVKMQELLRQEMEAGALGLSTGLEYDPGIYSSTDEIVALARVAASLGGRYTSHIRSEDRKLWEAIDEAITVGREARIPVQLSHLKLAMRGLWGQSDRLIQVLDRARANGVQVTADVYPYPYWQSGVTVLFPDRNYDDLEEAEFVLRELVSPNDLLFGTFPPNAQYAGKTLRQIASLRGARSATTLLALIKEAESAGVVASVVATSMDERDIARIIRWPFSNISSDGALAAAHPRGFGSFPRVLGRYVRRGRVVTLEEAVRKMTSLSARNMGLAHRGLIAAGQYADLVLFDRETVLDRATTAEPHATSLGIETVWVNGEAVFSNSSTTGKRPGHVLRRSGSR